MSARRKVVDSRRVLFRECHVCGKSIVIMAETPFVRQLPADGKKQKTCYFCSESCKASTYKHMFDGKADVRRKEREQMKRAQKNKRYYARHQDRERDRARERYWADPESARLSNQYSRKKRKLMKGDGRNEDRSV